jgi:predicted 2-oxoglutarate/Fe(II)-dependent dioxygenase YbiX
VNTDGGELVVNSDCPEATAVKLPQGHEVVYHVHHASTNPVTRAVLLGWLPPCKAVRRADQREPIGLVSQLTSRKMSLSAEEDL